MRLQRISLTALLTLVATLTIGDFPLIQNPQSQIQTSLVLAQTPDARKAEADRLKQQGIEQSQTRQFKAAFQSWQQALVIYREIKDRQGEGRVLNNLGLGYYLLGDYAKAIDHQQQSIAIAKEIKDREGEGKALANLGNNYYYLGDYTKAIDYHQQSLAIAKAIKDREGEGKALGYLGDDYNALGDYAKAIDYYQQSLAIFREVHNRPDESRVLGSLGNAYENLGDYAKAIDYHQQYLAIAKGMHDREGEGAALNNLGNAYNALGDYAKAIDYHQQSLAIFREVHDRQGEGGALGNLGVDYGNLGEYAKAIDYHQQSLAIRREIKDRDGEGTTLNNLGFALFKSGNLTEAEKNLRTGIEVWESQRGRLGNDDAYKVSIFEEQARTYRLLQEVLIAQNKTDVALEIAERGRSRAFVELLARRLSPVGAQGLAPLPTVASPTIEQIKQIAKTQNSTLVQYSIIPDDFKIKSKQESHESELYIWVIKPTGEVTFRSSDLKPLWQQQNTSLPKLVTNSRESIGVRSRAIIEVVPTQEALQNSEVQATKRLQQLHQLLIEPIADQLPTDPNAHVIFVPQSSLFLVPFAALQDKQGKYLIEKHTILTAPSIQVLDLTQKQRQKKGSGEWGVGSGDALVVGNPTMPSVPPAPGEKPQQLPSLPGAEHEAQVIAPLLNTKPLIGKDATKIAIKQLMPKARIIHLATHGLLDDVRGIGSAIALAPSGNDDGLLTVDQILNLKLNAELVVLSACDTGRGRVTGDGVIGLSRSLISVGVPSVIVSLWSVPDSPTASLMTEFYRQMQQQPDKAQALRSAMLTTMKQYPNPKDWAAFTLIGEAE